MMQRKIPAVFMRGGTGKVILFHARDLGQLLLGERCKRRDCERCSHCAKKFSAAGHSTTLFARGAATPNPLPIGDAAHTCRASRVRLDIKTSLRLCFDA